MEHRNVAALSKDVIAWSETLPRDIDVIVGIPRSGMLVASLLALHMDRPLTDLDGYLAGRTFTGGKRTRDRHTTGQQHALVVDDSVWSGRAMREARTLVEQTRLPGRTSFGAVYVDTGTAADVVDHWHAAIPVPRVFGWNVLHHDLLPQCCMDIDGVLCRDPTTQENDDGPRYAAFLENVPVRLVPGVEVGWLVTSRLERYRPQTEAWLAKHGIRYRHLVMHPAASGLERVQAGDHAHRKAQVYVDTDAWLFLESDLGQARTIARVSGKAVYCVDAAELVKPAALAAARRRALDLPRRTSKVAARLIGRDGVRAR